MARHGLMHEALGAAHEKNETPYIAAAFAAAMTFVCRDRGLSAGATPFESRAISERSGSFGFLSAYILVSLAAPAYLRKLKQLDRTRSAGFRARGQLQ